MLFGRKHLWIKFDSLWISEENKKITLNVNNQEFKIIPYKDKNFTSEKNKGLTGLNKKAAEELEKHIPGIEVSNQHLQSILKGKEYGEKFDIAKVLEKKFINCFVIF